jgi:hypothetical protein
MMAQETNGAHSAHVDMQLIVNGDTIQITHMASDYVHVQCDHEYPPGEATIILQVDESRREWTVRLPQGVSKGSSKVALALCKKRD